MLSVFAHEASACPAIAAANAKRWARLKLGARFAIGKTAVGVRSR
jgi:hypothetical protein